MTQWDYVIVGAGSAGCVLAERLSADPSNSVLLLEAGPSDRSQFIHMPRGVAKLYTDPAHMWYFQTEAHDDVPSETWIRGKVLGGSSSINGMMYFHGQPSDYDGWEALGARGWGSVEIAKAFREMECHELGAGGGRGDSGPLRITVERDANPLSEAFVDAGTQLGLPRVEDLNNPGADGQAVGYVPRTIHGGRRQSSAKAFLGAARGRANLTVMTGVDVSRVVFDGRRAVAVEASTNGGARRFEVVGEVILSAGALMSPQILERSGVGAADRLSRLGVPVIADSPGVGEHMLEHRLLMTQYDVNSPHTDGRHLRGWRLLRSGLSYYLAGKGKLTSGYGTVGAFAKVLEESETADIEILYTPVIAAADTAGNMVVDPRPSIQIFGYPLRSRSEGHVHIQAADRTAPAQIRAGYLTDPYDQRVTVAMFRFIREWLGQPALAAVSPKEREPTASLRSDADILRAFRTIGQAGYHTCGTCRMGDFGDAVVDEKCRVKGVSNLRVVDASIMPAMVSSNTNGPVMASAWRAAKLILEARGR